MSNVFKAFLNNVVSQGLIGDLPALQSAVLTIPIALRRPIVKSAACILFNNKSIHDRENFLSTIQYLCNVCGNLKIERIGNNTFSMKKL